MGESPLARAHVRLIEAELAESAADRFLLAHQASLLVAAAIVAARAHAASWPRSSDVWQLTAVRAPELAEWAGYFSAIQEKRRVVAAGATALVSWREADDLVRDAAAFREAARVSLRSDGCQHDRAVG